MLNKTILALLLAATSSVAVAQQNVADKIIATVGNKVILQSELNYAFNGYLDKNPDLKEDTKCELLKNMIAEKILVEQSYRDSIIVTDEEVEQTLDQRIQQILMGNFGGNKEAMESETKRTIFQTKEEFRPVIKDQLIANKVQQTIMQKIVITPKEVETFFNTLPIESKSQIPATFEVGELVIKPKVSEEMDKYAKDKLSDIRKQIVDDGKDFATMAQIYGEDGTRDEGGRMQSNKKALDSKFGTALARLKPGEISPVFKSSFGYHIIQLISRVGDDFDFRHILIIPPTTTQDLTAAMDSLNVIYNKLINKEITFNTAVEQYSNDDESKRSGGMIINPNTGSSTLVLESVTDPDVSFAITQMKVGEFSKPETYKPENNPKVKYARILFLKSRTEPHELNLQDDYTLIQNKALSMKQDKQLMEWVKDKIPKYYINISPEYVNNCESIKEIVSQNTK